MKNIRDKIFNFLSEDPFILEKNKILASKEQQQSTVYYTTGNPKELQKFVSEDGCIEKVSITL